MSRDAVRGVNRAWLRRLYSFAVPPTLAFYFDVPLDEAMKRISVGRAELKYYEAGLDLGLSSDPYESFRLFQGLIRREYEQVIGEFGLVRMDATESLVQQQQRMREIVRPYLDGAMRLPNPAPEDPLRVAGLLGPSPGRAKRRPRSRRRDGPALLRGAAAGYRSDTDSARAADRDRRHRRRRALDARRVAEGVAGGARLRRGQYRTAPLRRWRAAGSSAPSAATRSIR